MSTISFKVPGIPRPGGSKTAFYNKALGRAIMVDACKNNKPWRQTIQVFAKESYKGEPLRGPVGIDVTFYMPRPKSHYGTGKKADVLKPAAPIYHTSKPDATKLLRAAEDALTGILWVDDAQICMQSVSKFYGTPGMEIRVVNMNYENEAA